MAALAYPRQEALAQGVARGQTLTVAAQAVGYSLRSKYFYRVAKNGSFIMRLAEITETVAWSGSQSLVPLIDALKGCVDKAIADDKGLAGIKLAADILFRIATLKQQLPPDPLPDCVVAAFEKPVSVTLGVEEWSRQFPPAA